MLPVPRLLANAIIFYNATLLENLINHYDGIGQVEKSSFIKRLSPVAWTHINFYGQYEFLAENIIDIDGLLNQVKKKDFYLFEDQNN